jgi:hypothetical protein
MTSNLNVVHVRPLKGAISSVACSWLPGSVPSPRPLTETRLVYTRDKYMIEQPDMCRLLAFDPSTGVPREAGLLEADRAVFVQGGSWRHGSHSYPR